MFTILVLFLLYTLVSWLVIAMIKFICSKHIKRTNAIKKSLYIRRIYSIVRLVVRLIVIGVGLVLMLVTFIETIEMKHMQSGFIMIIGEISLIIILLSSLSLPLNFITIEKFFKKKKKYSLYLRGFITDSYYPSMEKLADKVSEFRHPLANVGKHKEIPNPNTLPLCERELAMAWKRFFPIYGVGLPEELESPEGVKRIYLDNMSWKEDVLRLMDDAEYIIVRVNSNDNCIWEIERCSESHSEKTIYYIDSLHELNQVKDKMGASIPPGLNSIQIIHEHMYVYHVKDQFYVRDYDNTVKGFSASVWEFVSRTKDSGILPCL